MSILKTGLKVVTAVAGAPVTAASKAIAGKPKEAAKILATGGLSNAQKKVNPPKATQAEKDAAQKNLNTQLTTNNPLAKMQAEAKKKADAEKAKAAAAKKKEEDFKKSDAGAVSEIEKAMKTAAGDITKLGEGTAKSLDAAAKQGKQALDLYKSTLAEKEKLLEQKAKEIEGLSKWHQGIVTSYEDLAERYKTAVTGLDGAERKGMETKAKGDYMAMSGLGAQAAGIQAGAMGGPATGLQQQLMGAAFQQQATSAYSNSMKNISQVDEQRRQMQFAMTQAASADERSNRQLGYNMESGQIQQGVGVINNQIGIAGSMYGASMTDVQMGREDALTKYGIGMNTIQGRTAANTYAPTARMALNNKEMMAGFTNRGLDLQQQTINKSSNINPWAAAGTGAAAGAAFGPWGAAAGAGIGFLGATMTNK